MAQQNKQDIIRPITIILDGSTSYHAWSQNMTICLKCRKLWRYIIDSIPEPMPLPQSKAIIDADTSKTTIRIEDDYKACLEEQESIQSKIMSWFINTSVPSSYILLPRFDTAVGLWPLGYFCPVATIVLMIQVWSSTLNSSFIRCAKRQFSLFLIIILRLLLSGNNSLLQILH